MNVSRFTGAALALTLAATTASAQSVKLSDKDVSAIKSSSEAFSKAVLGGDVTAASRFYTEASSFMPPNDKAVAGRAAISAWIKSLPPVKDIKLTPVDIEGRGDLAYVKGTFSMTLAPAGAPGPITDVGKYVEIRRKQADGSWLIDVDIFNSDLPPPK